MCALRCRRNRRAICIKEWLTASLVALRQAGQPSAYTMVSRSSSRLSNKPALATSSLLSLGGGSALLFAPPHQFSCTHWKILRMCLCDAVPTWQWQLAKVHCCWRSEPANTRSIHFDFLTKLDGGQLLPTILRLSKSKKVQKVSTKMCTPVVEAPFSIQT